MKLQGQATINDVVTAFLQAEIAIPRHHDRYHAALASLGHKNQPPGFLTSTTFTQLRADVLTLARGWPNKDLFQDFPTDVNWHWSVMETADLDCLLYIHYSYWDLLSHGSHRVVDGAKAVQAGKTFFEVPNDPFWEVAGAIKAGKAFPPLVLLKGQGNDYIVVEGHTRSTGFALAGMVPAGQLCIVGTFVGENNWGKEKKL